MVRKVSYGILLAALILVTPVLATAGDWCDDGGGWHKRGYHCEVRELTLPADRAVIEVDAGQNGGISVMAWDRNEILIEAKVAGQADSDGEAADLVSQVRIDTAGVILAEGPRSDHDESWWVSYRLHVPRSSNLDLEAHNGGISIAGVVGELRFDTTNGGIDLERVGGDVRGETTNGGVKVELSGDSWQGVGLDVETTNGGVKVLIPDDYNARLATGTTNGHLEVDFPLTLQGKIGREIEVDLGSGGTLLRVMTTNGGVRIDRL
jgi:hypothetical protein